MNFNPFNKLDAFPKDIYEVQNNKFEKNFKNLIKMIKREIPDLTPIQEERAKKIFNECLESGLLPDSMETTEQIYKKIVDDIKNPDSSENFSIADKRPDAEPKAPTSSIGKIFEN